MTIITKEELIKKLLNIKSLGWVESRRQGTNSGAVGNTLEDLLGIKENNLAIPNAAEWELKCQRSRSKALVTLFHFEPSPENAKIVPTTLLPLYGWPHAEAGKKYEENEMSFRQTIQTSNYSDRGFKVVVDHNEKRVAITFDASRVHARHAEWLESVRARVGLAELYPQPYWGFLDLFHKAGTKLHNMIFVQVDTKSSKGIGYFHYNTITLLRELSLENFINAIETGVIYVDFDARTGHNHGTKFRVKANFLSSLYQYRDPIE